jgi:hypothetical protein
MSGGLKELRVMYDHGLIADLATEVVSPGELPRNPRTGKIRLVEDRRKAMNSENREKRVTPYCSLSQQDTAHAGYRTRRSGAPPRKSPCRHKLS